MRLLVVGAGATGGFFGGRLTEAGRDVTFLVRPERAAQIASHGLEIVSPHGDAIVHPKLVTAPNLKEPFDAVLLAVKGWGLAAALEDLAPAIGPETVILPVLNGMRHLDVLIERFGRGAIGGGLCKVAGMLDDEGRIHQLSDLQDLAYGELDGKPSARMAAVDAFMTGAGFPARLSPIIVGEMWEKWLMLASLGAITCLMRGTIGDVVAAPGGRDFALGLIDEAVAIVSAVGVPPRPAVVDGIRATMTQAGSAFASSMYRDLLKGNRVEADEIVGDLVARGRAVGIAAPLLAAAHTHLGVYAARRGS